MASPLKERQKVRKREQGAADRGRDTMGGNEKMKIKAAVCNQKQDFQKQQEAVSSVDMCFLISPTSNTHSSEVEFYIVFTETQAHFTQFVAKSFSELFLITPKPHDISGTDCKKTNKKTKI